MNKYYEKPVIRVYEVEPVKLFACSEGCPQEDDTFDLGYDESNKFWESITAD